MLRSILSNHITKNIKLSSSSGLIGISPSLPLVHCFSYSTTNINDNNNSSSNSKQTQLLNNIKVLRNDIKKYNDLYYNKSQSIISDFEYDMLFKKLQSLETQYKSQYGVDDVNYGDSDGDVESPISQIGAPLSTSSQRGEKVKHLVRMLSLDNTYSKEDLQAFEARVLGNLSKLGSITSNQRVEYICELKYDGIGLSIIYDSKGRLERVVTRGDGDVGEVITTNALHYIPSIPKQLNNLNDYIQKQQHQRNWSDSCKIEIRGEVVFKKSKLKVLNTWRSMNDEVEYKNTRNIVSGKLRSILDVDDNGEDEDSSLDIQFDFIAYQLFMHQTNNNQINSVNGSTTETTHSNNMKVIEKMGFNIDHNAIIVDTLSIMGGDGQQNQTKLDEFIKKWSGMSRESFDWDIDGIVIKVNSLKQQSLLGQANRSPRWAVAFKFGARSMPTIVKNIQLQIGRSGKVTPVAEVEPVDIHGVTVSKATLNNLSFIQKLGIRIGSQVLVERAGDVIPKIVQSLNSTDEPMSKEELLSMFERCDNDGDSDSLKCPCSLGTPLSQPDGYQDYYCFATNCPNQQLQRINWYVSKDGMNMTGIGPSQIKVFLDNGLIDDIGDLYTLKEKKEQLLKLRGFSDKKVNNILESIEKSKKENLAHLICALGIPGVGKAGCKQLANRFKTLDKLSTATLQEIEEIGELGPNISFSIFDYFHPSETDQQQSSSNSIESLLSILELHNAYDKNWNHGNNNNNTNGSSSSSELNHQHQDFITNSGSSNSIFKDKNIVVTGKFKLGSREEIQEMIEKRLGGIVQSAIRNNTHYLIIGEDSTGTSSKVKKAEQIGTTILSELEFNDIINNRTNPSQS